MAIPVVGRGDMMPPRFPGARRPRRNRKPQTGAPRSTTNLKDLAKPRPTPKPTSRSLAVPLGHPSSTTLTPPSTAPGPISITAHPVGQTPTRPASDRNSGSGGLSSGDIAAAVVVPVLVVTFGILAAFLILRRRRQDRSTAAAGAGGAGGGQVPTGSSTSMVHQVQYSKTNSLEQPPPPYVSHSEKPPTPPRLDAGSLLHPPKAPGGDPNGSQPPSPSFAETVFMTNPGLVAEDTGSTVAGSPRSTNAQRDTHAFNRTLSPNSGVGGGNGRARDDDEVSAMSDDGEGLYDGDTEVEYAEAGMAQRHRASVVDMNLMSGSPPKG